MRIPRLGWGEENVGAGSAALVTPTARNAPAARLHGAGRLLGSSLRRRPAALLGAWEPFCSCELPPPPDHAVPPALGPRHSLLTPIASPSTSTAPLTFRSS